MLPGASQLRIPARSWLEGRDSSEVSLFFLISHYYGRIGLLTVVDLSMVDAPCLTGARGDDSGQLPVWDNSEGGGLRGDGGYGFGIPGAAAGELDRLLSNTMLAWLLDSLSMQVLVTWHTATGEASSNLAD